MTTLWLPDGVNGTLYSQELHATQGIPPYTWAITDPTQLPSGLKLSGDTLSGIPDTSGIYTFMAQVTDQMGMTNNHDFTITIRDPALAITTLSLLPGIVGQDYSQTLQSTGANGALTWSLSASNLPQGLHLDANQGIISGQPDQSGRVSFTVQLTDGSSTVTRDFTLNVSASGGAVWAWGYDSEGQLGNGEHAQGSDPPIIHDSPVAVSNSSGLISPIQVDASSSASFALDKDGYVWSWGSGGNGQLGQGSNWTSYVPGKVVKADGTPLNNIVRIAAGSLGGMAIDSSGQLWTWGDDQQGQLGTGSSSFSQNYASPVTALHNVVAISSSRSGYDDLAVEADGSVWGWGWNSNGQVGNGDYTPDGNDIHTSVPSRVQGLTDIVAVANGFYYSMALDRYGHVWTWGSNYSGDLGLGTQDSSYSAHLLPVRIPGLQNVTAISVDSSSFALDSDGHVWAWGGNYNGILGVGSTSYAIVSPAKVVGPGGSGYLGNITGISAAPVLPWLWILMGTFGPGATMITASSPMGPMATLITRLPRLKSAT